MNHPMRLKAPSPRIVTKYPSYRMSYMITWRSFAIGSLYARIRLGFSRPLDRDMNSSSVLICGSMAVFFFVEPAPPDGTCRSPDISTQLRAFKSSKLRPAPEYGMTKLI